MTKNKLRRVNALKRLITNLVGSRKLLRFLPIADGDRSLTVQILPDPLYLSQSTLHAETNSIERLDALASALKYFGRRCTYVGSYRLRVNLPV